MTTLIYVICFLLSWAFLHHFLSQLSRRYKRLPPGPIPLPIIGNLLNLGTKPHISLARLAKIHGPVMSLQLGSLTTVVITSPSSAKEVMQKNDATFATMRTVPDAVSGANHSQMSMAFLPLDGMGKNLRKIANSEIFTSSRLDAGAHLRKEKVNDLLSHVEACCKAGVPVHINEAVFTIALNLMSCMFFSTDLARPPALAASGGTGTTISSNGKSCGGGGGVDGREFKEIIMQLMVESGKPNLSDFFPSLKLFDPQGRRKAMEAQLGKMLVFLDGLIDKRLVSTGRDSSDPDAAADTLDALLKMSQQSIHGFDRSFMTHMLADMYMGGTDTTSSTVEWAMTELLRNPTEMKKAQKELEEVIGRGNHVQESDISRLPYLQAVFKETMRLHPTIPLLLPRKASSDVIVSGFVVPKGTQVLVNVWAIHKDPQVWEDAYAFKPERFIGSNIDFKGLHFELIPFGSGRRICPGMPLAVRFVHLALASLIHSFDWKLEEGVMPDSLDMEEAFGTTLHKARPLRAVPLHKSSHMYSFISYSTCL